MTCSVQHIFSTLASDPEFCDLVAMYVDEMPERIQQIRDAFKSSDRDKLIRLIHQLKGAAGSYGFPTLTQEAAATEQALMNSDEDAGQAIENLLSTCERVRAGIRQAPAKG